MPLGASDAGLPVGDQSVHSHPDFLADVLAAHRRAIGSWWRKLPAGRQALRVVAHLRCGDTYTRLAAGFGVGVATVYRYIREAVGVLATLASTRGDAVRVASAKAYVILDGTLLPIDRIAADRPFRAIMTPHHAAA